jgi:3-hydroxyacyl-[acyl-carrier-protein] dehydratase
MLRDNLYKIKEINNANNTIEALIQLIEDNEIFKGHFPDMPVLPGVCQVEICKELLSHQLQKHFVLKEAASIKFLAFITPNEVKELNAKINFTENAASCDVNASLYSGEKTFLKLQAKFTPDILQ